MNWLIDDFTQQRSGILYEPPADMFGSISHPVEAAFVWHCWDFKVAAGTYELSFVTTHADYINYFVVGNLDSANRTLPLRLGERFPGAVFQGYQLGMLSTLPFLRDPIRFFLANPSIIRLESWAQRQMWQNPVPLPEGLGIWTTVQPHEQHQEWGNTVNNWNPGVFQIVKVGDPVGFGFGSDYPTVSRRDVAEDKLIFSAEDGADSNFGDLVVALARVGD